MSLRVLVVDDSVVVRRIMSDALSSGEVKVVGTAIDGRFALRKIADLRPDLIILDVEMPEMGGLDALVQIRKDNPRLPVIMFSSHTKHGAETTLRAIELGASDYFLKPSGTGGLSASIDSIREQLLPRIKMLCRGSLPRFEAAPPATQVVPSRPPGLRPATSRVEIVVIGVSTGGPAALSEVLPRLEKTFPVPILIVQHMPPLFTSLLAERLNAKCAIEVREAVDGMIARPGQALIAPGDFHMTLANANGCIRLHQGPPENSCRPSVDVLFRSAADVCGASALGVILTGMGRDGFAGCERIRSLGGQVIAQDEETSVVWGMPGVVAQAGLADRIVPIGQVLEEITFKIRCGRPALPVTLEKREPAGPAT